MRHKFLGIIFKYPKADFFLLKQKKNQVFLHTISPRNVLKIVLENHPLYVFIQFTYSSK